MAALQLREDTTTGRLILQPALASRVGSLVFSFIWLTGAGIFLLPMFFGRGIDWLAVMAFLFFAFVPVSASLLNAMVATTVTIDRSTRTLSSVRSLFFLPIATKTFAFSDLTKIELQYVAGSSAVNVWLVNAVSRSNQRIRINWNGAQREMADLAQKISALTRVPVLQAEYTLPAALQGALKKIAPAALEQAKPTSNMPMPPSTPPAQPAAGLERWLRELADQTVLEEAPPPVSTAPSPLPMNEFARTQEPSVAGALEAEAKSTKDVWSLSVNDLEQRVARDSMDADARYALARRYHARGDLGRALELYRQVARIDPTNPSVHNDLGVAWQLRGKHAEAEAAYRRAVALDPFSSTKHLNLALLLRASHRATEARQEFFLARQNARAVEERERAEAASGGARLDPQLSKT